MPHLQPLRFCLHYDLQASGNIWRFVLLNICSPSSQWGNSGFLCGNHPHPTLGPYGLGGAVSTPLGSGAAMWLSLVNESSTIPWAQSDWLTVRTATWLEKNESGVGEGYVLWILGNQSFLSSAEARERDPHLSCGWKSVSRWCWKWCPDSAVTHKESHWGLGVIVSLILTLCKAERREREREETTFLVWTPGSNPTWRKPLDFSFSRINTPYYSKGRMFCVSFKCYKKRTMKFTF